LPKSRAIRLAETSKKRKQSFQVEFLKSEHELMRKAVDQGLYYSISDLIRRAVDRELKRVGLKGKSA